jgi:hypothetical protein
MEFILLIMVARGPPDAGLLLYFSIPADRPAQNLLAAKQPANGTGFLHHVQLARNDDE